MLYENSGLTSLRPYAASDAGKIGSGDPLFVGSQLSYPAFETRIARHWPELISGSS
jgi:hypothetical protein